MNLKVQFAPLKPFSCACNLLVSKITGGGRWRFSFQLEVNDPDVDDIIEIESPLNKAASVAFRLTNHTNSYTEFDAFFDSDSALEFQVQPSSGVLEPKNSVTGTTFVVTFKPTEYGTHPTGKLVIQTEDAMWSYQVKGHHPRYTAPIVDKAQVNTRLSKEVSDAMQRQKTAARKNFIKTNISATKSTRPL